MRTGEFNIQLLKMWMTICLPSYVIVLPLTVFLYAFNSYYARTDPRDVARMESKTFVCTLKKSDTIPTPKEGVKCKLGNWKHTDEMDKELDKKFAGCMKGNIFEECYVHYYLKSICHLTIITFP